jgi:hypothetical protein
MLLSDVLATLEADTFDFWEDSARLPGGARGREDGVTWFRTGIPLTNYNGLLGNATNVASMLERVRRWNLPARWIISTANAPDGLERDLADGGCSLMEDAPGMIARIDELPAPQTADVHVEVVRDQAAFDEWADVFCDAFGVPENAAPHIHRAHSWPCLHNENRTYFLMRRGRDAVATGLLHSRAGIAGVYGIGVRRAFQKQGLGALATLLTVREGARRGAQLTLLQATAQGFPVYAKLGFRTITSFRSWRIV